MKSFLSHLWLWTNPDEIELQRQQLTIEVVPRAVTRHFEQQMNRTRCRSPGCDCWTSEFHGNLCVKHAPEWKRPVNLLGLGRKCMSEKNCENLERVLDPCLFAPFRGVSSYMQMRRFEIALAYPKCYLVVNMNSGAGRRLGAFVDTPEDLQHWFTVDGMVTLEGHQDWFVIDPTDRAEILFLVDMMADLPSRNNLEDAENDWWTENYLGAMNVLNRRIGDARDED
jgi:hypothetical protein